jgi:hypothetical protein
MAGHPTRDEARAIAKRRDDALQLRLAGVDYLTIGRKLAADPSVNSDGVAYPQGYGVDRWEAGEEPPDDDRLAKLVRDDLNRAYAQRRANLDRNLEELRDLQDLRLERLFTAAYQAALGGDAGAIDKAVRIMERQARLHGLDAPTRQEITGADGGPIELTPAQQARAEAVRHLELIRGSGRANRAALTAAVEGDPEQDQEPEPADA